MIDWIVAAYRRLLPRCRSLPPERLADADVCIRPRGHHRWDREDADWHADGTGYIWNDALGRWRWMGPPVGVEDAYEIDPEFRGVFTEEA